MPLDHTNLAEFHLKHFSKEWIENYIMRHRFRKRYSVWFIGKGDKWEERNVDDKDFRLQRGHYVSESLNKKITKLERYISSIIRKQRYFFGDTDAYDDFLVSQQKNVNMLLSFLMLSMFRLRETKEKHHDYAADKIRKEGYALPAFSNGIDYEGVTDQFLFSNRQGIEIFRKRLNWRFVNVEEPYLLIIGNHPWIEISNPNKKEYDTLNYTVEDRLNDIREIYFPISCKCCLVGLQPDLEKPSHMKASEINIMLAVTCNKYLVSSQKGFAGDAVLFKSSEVCGNKNPWYQNQNIAQWKPI